MTHVQDDSFNRSLGAGKPRLTQEEAFLVDHAPPKSSQRNVELSADDGDFGTLGMTGGSGSNELLIDP